MCSTGTHFLKQKSSPVSPLYKLLLPWRISLHSTHFYSYPSIVCKAYLIAAHFWQSSSSTSVWLNPWFAPECVGQIQPTLLLQHAKFHHGLASKSFLPSVQLVWLDPRWHLNMLLLKIVFIFWVIWHLSTFHSSWFLGATCLHRLSHVTLHLPLRLQHSWTAGRTFVRAFQIILFEITLRRFQRRGIVIILLIIGRCKTGLFLSSSILVFAPFVLSLVAFALPHFFFVALVRLVLLLSLLTPDSLRHFLLSCRGERRSEGDCGVIGMATARM